MNPKDLIGAQILKAAEDAQHVNVDELIARERSSLRTCPECGKAFKPTTKDELEICFRCLGDE